MSHDTEVLLTWLRVVLIITAICVTAVPIIYSFSPWYKRPLGRLFMLQAISFAVAFDITGVFSVWKPYSLVFRLWVDVLMMTPIAFSTLALVVFIWRMNFSKRRGGSNDSE